MAITNRTTTSYADTNMPSIGQTYYYRVLVWSTNGLADTGVGDLIYHPAYGQVATNYPFAEGFETGSTHWAFDQPWAVTTQMAHTGATSLGSNPGTDYANNTDASAYLSLDLTKANRPMLSFWQCYALEPNQDYGFVEISSNQGASWAACMP